MYERIRALREDRDLSQKQLSQALHCSQQVYSNYELTISWAARMKNSGRTTNKYPPAKAGVFQMRAKPYDTGSASRRITV